MNMDLERLRALIGALSEGLEAEQNTCRESLARLRESVRDLQRDSADQRFRVLARDVESLDAHLQRLAGGRGQELLSEAGDVLRRIEALQEDALVGAVARRLEEGPALTLVSFSERFLAGVLESMAAQRGFVLFCLPDSTEAQVVAARDAASGQLARSENAHCKTLVARVVREGQPLLFSKATEHPELLEVKSVQRLQLNSLLVIPLRHEGRMLGALYLENRDRAEAFDETDLRSVRAAARFAMAWLRRARLLDGPLPHGTSLFLDDSKSPREMVGDDPKIHALRALIDRVAGQRVHVLIEGESGTGKELVAWALHDRSPRRAKQFVAQNCAAFPRDLLEVELFGHEKGAFTGAVEKRPGLVELAEGGTLFLDEIHKLPHALQPKLLRFLENGEFRPVGATAAKQADVQVIAAASDRLRDLVRAGEFLDELYYRLNVITLEVPPLRDRKNDIDALVDHFVRRFCTEYDKVLRVDADVYDRLRRYSFPGNVRELRNILWRLVLLADGDRIRVTDLPSEVLGSPIAGAAGPPATSSDARPPDSVPTSLEEIRHRRREARRLLAEQERVVVERAVQQAGGNVTEAASRLGLNRVTLHRILRRSSPGLSVPHPSEPSA